MRFLLLTLLLHLTLLGGLTAGQVWEVCSECTFTSIQAAIKAAAPGDEIRIGPGRYRESPIVVDRPLTLTGIDYPVLDGEGKSEVLTITADRVTVQGLRIEHVGKSYTEDRAGIRVVRKRHFVIRDNQLYDTFFGIYLERASDGLIENNHIIGLAENEMSSGNAIHAWHCKRLDVLYNQVQGHRDGIYFEFVDHSSVQHNRSEGNLRYGLHFMFSNFDSYTCNEFIDNGAGVAVMFSKFIDMYQNRFERNWGRSSYGLLLKEIYDGTIRYNEFRGNTIGINIEGSTRIDYHYNTFAANGWAIKVAGGCLDNDFSRNNFRQNTLDLVVNSHINGNSFDGNYWSEYSGYDLDRDGVGDVPHRPVKLFAFILDKAPEAIVLLRSLFVDLLNYAEKVSPVFTPADVLDYEPKMEPVLW